jgi:dTDP-4-amino-4,6-dideoxygalactose transaminase
MSALCEAFGAVLIEDAAQAAGATVGGQRAGTLASIGILSFGRGKGINAGGGGAVILKEPWASRDLGPLPEPSAAASFAQLFRVMLTQLLAHPAVYAIPSALPWLGIGKTVYQPVPAPTGASRTTRLLLPTAERVNNASLSYRRALAEGYATRLSGIPGIGLVRTAWAKSGALRFPVRLDFEPAKRFRRLGVVRSYPRTLIEYAPVRTALASGSTHFPGAELLARSLYTLPTHVRCSEAKAGRIIQLLIEEARTTAGQRLNADS